MPCRRSDPAPVPVFLSAALLAVALLTAGCGERITDDTLLADDSIAAAEAVLGLSLTAEERDLMRDDLVEQRDAYADMREYALDNAVVPALRFDPLLWYADEGLDMPDEPLRYADPGPQVRPADLDDLAFATIPELGRLLRDGQVTSVELTELALGRLRRFDPDLECVVTLLPERALARARELDIMLARGEDLGPLHGIPYGAKDLLAVAGAPTTWGAEPYRRQVRDETATVVELLDAAGAVLVAKLSLGALAWGEVWFGGTTRNPWDLEQGSSGSSAGSAAAVSAGLVPFAIGTETWGSIVSPASRCGVTGLRPTFGRVSRAGAMALSWSMDKIGPIARTTEDCALVFDAIRGSDGLDPTVVDRPFPYDSARSLQGLRIGYLEDAFAEDYPGREQDRAALDVLRELCREQGAELAPVVLPLESLGVDLYDLSIILSAEGAAAFQELTLSGRDDELVRQTRYAWPNVFRAANFIPAVEYIQANRWRTLLAGAMHRLFDDVDVYVTPSFAGDSLLLTNLTGHPQVVVPNGVGRPYTEENALTSFGFVGRLHDEATVLAVARAYEQATPWHKKHPPGY